jgi:hypothetical protein
MAATSHSGDGTPVHKKPGIFGDAGLLKPESTHAGTVRNRKYPREDSNL